MTATIQQENTRRAIAWAQSHAVEMGWIGEHMERNEFAMACAMRIEQHGELTPNMLAAVQRSTSGTTAAVAISVAEIEARFAVARGNLVKQPRMRLDTFVFKAVIKGANAGGIYVTEGSGEEGVYLGKVMGGNFLPSRDCTADQKSRILAAAADPAAAAVAYGQRTGNCCICGRELTAEESIERFIGPICAERFGL